MMSGQSAFMTKRIVSLSAAALIAAALLASAALPAAATEGGTETTFSITPGYLSVTEQPRTDPGRLVGRGRISFPLGRVDVTDARGGTLGWTVIVTSTPFTTAGHGPRGGTASTRLSYSAGNIVVRGTVTAGSAGDTEISEQGAVVVTGSAVSGNNTARWIPVLTVSLPNNALSGHYADVVNTSIS